MQNKGALKFLTIVLALACLYQLSFTFVTKSVEKEALEASHGDPAAEQRYLDSVKSQVVYNLGLVKYTYAECKSKELNLGLDLKGGMNVMLEISEEDILRSLSNNNPDPAFNKALAEARTASQNNGAGYIDNFLKAYEKADPAGRLAGIFSTIEMGDKVTVGMSNDEVIKVLKEQASDAITNSYNVLRNRIDRFGVTQPNIQRLENSGRILVELPGIKEPERVRKLLQGTASLEFWSTYNNREIYPMLESINNRLAQTGAIDTPDTTVAEVVDSMVQADALASRLDSLESGLDSTANAALIAKQYPLFSKLMPVMDQQGRVGEGPVVGYANAADTAAVNSMLNRPDIRVMLPRDIKLMWGVKAMKGTDVIYELFAIKANTRQQKAPLDGSAITEARAEYSQSNGAAAEVSMVMNAMGAKTWARLTKENTGNYIAIVLDDYVYSAPLVHGEIPGGRSSISGNFTYNEANDLAIVLKSGKLPAPARIIQEAVVGPSLGQESIDAGMMSFILAFVLVMLYMVIFYNTAGIIVNIALLTNLFFLFGVLASFGAVLTLPGIAGIVLTMGMAVDANVIIFERIKEELRAGKGINLAIADGFKNAYSAIIDGNMTTMLTGIVLFIFGTGPVQGFATTLIIGIITSLFTAIFITRLMIEGAISHGWNIKFSNKLTENFLSNTNIDFVGKRKYTYIISAILIVATLVSFAVRGMSYGVDFSGGRAYVVRFDQNVGTNDVRAALGAKFTEGLEVKQYGNNDQMRIVTQYKYQESSDEVTDEINMMLYESLSPLFATPLTIEEFMTTAQNPYGIISSDNVGPSVANDIKRNAIIAVIFSLIAIGGYIAWRFKKWQWAMGGVIALIHDALITIGVFSMFWGILPFNLDVDQSFIAAILTIIGYSINNTVVIFDRIRENRTLYPKRKLKDNINSAVNSTLARTVNTTGTTLVVLLAIFIFGGEVIRGFIFALLFGMVIGTFSSIFVSTPVSYDFMKKKLKSGVEVN
ncbi:MAG: protein translocase subunit SecDF [Rikenellaceae bacterium]|nr:protein translocase subunit SecDF [Rikenellaceae bacterium]